MFGLWACLQHHCEICWISAGVFNQTVGCRIKKYESKNPTDAKRWEEIWVAVCPPVTDCWTAWIQLPPCQLKVTARSVSFAQPCGWNGLEQEEHSQIHTYAVRLTAGGVQDGVFWQLWKRLFEEYSTVGVMTSFWRPVMYILKVEGTVKFPLWKCGPDLRLNMQL